MGEKKIKIFSGLIHRESLMLRNVFNVDRKLSTWKTVVIFNSIHAYKRVSFDVHLNCVKCNITMPGRFFLKHAVCNISLKKYYCCLSLNIMVVSKSISHVKICLNKTGISKLAIILFGTRITKSFQAMFF